MSVWTQFWCLLQAIDHIINSAAKSNYMSAGQISVPIVFRGPNGAAAGVGAQHSHVCFGFAVQAICHRDCILALEYCLYYFTLVVSCVIAVGPKRKRIYKQRPLTLSAC